MLTNTLAPICLFVYSRLNETQQTVAALQQNFLASQSELIIFSDGEKGMQDRERVAQVRHYIDAISGFRKVTIHKSDTNKGLANSIIGGVTLVINQYGKAIVLEDDLITSPNFIDFMNQGLVSYEGNKKIISVCGYGLKIKKPKDYKSDVYLYRRSSSWGWATWKDRWDAVDWEVLDWNEFKKDRKAIRAFKRSGSDMYKMLKSVTEGNAQSWAIRFCYAQFKQQKYSVMPFYSLVANIGFTGEGTNTKHRFSRFKTEKDSGAKRKFELDKHIEVNHQIQKACYKYHSIPIRAYSRFRYLIGL